MHLKLRSLSDIVKIRGTLRRQGRRVVLTNGCFDILHPGHVEYLEHAKSFGDVLVVALNGDRSVRALKGPSRPIMPARARAELLAGLAAVDHVVVFNTKRVTPIISAVQPDVYVKGGDYTLATLNPEERGALEKCRAKIQLVKFKLGYSTSSIIKKIKSLPD